MLSTIHPAALDADTAEQATLQLDTGALQLPEELRETLREIVAELRAGNEVTVMSSSRSSTPTFCTAFFRLTSSSPSLYTAPTGQPRSSQTQRNSERRVDRI